MRATVGASVRLFWAAVAAASGLPCWRRKTSHSHLNLYQGGERKARGVVLESGGEHVLAKGRSQRAPLLNAGMEMGRAEEGIQESWLTRLLNQMLYGHWKFFDQGGQGAGASERINGIGAPVRLHEPAPFLVREVLVTQGSSRIGEDLRHKGRIIEHAHNDALELVITHVRMAPNWTWSRQ